MAMKDFWDIIQQVIEESDLVIEVLDARMPEETRNRKAESLVKISRKPLILAVNKADLVAGKAVKKTRENLQKDAFCVFVSSKNRRGISFLKRKIFEIGQKRSRRGLISVGFIGYPNTGKSSLINALAGRKKAKVSPRPGLTRGIQWISGGPGIRLVDTPGVIPLSEKDEVRQTMANIIDPSKVDDPEGVAREIVEMFIKENKAAFENFYKIHIGSKRFNGIVKQIGTARKMLKKGGKLDEMRVYITIINDWQKGKLLLKG